jgi:hypothetical protein
MRVGFIWSKIWGPISNDEKSFFSHFSHLFVVFAFLLIFQFLSVMSLTFIIDLLLTARNYMIFAWWENKFR